MMINVTQKDIEDWENAAVAKAINRVTGKIVRVESDTILDIFSETTYRTPEKVRRFFKTWHDGYQCVPFAFEMKL